MVFSSLLFLFRFLPVMLLVYFAAPRRFRNGVLFIGSLIFYGWGEPVYITLLLFSTVVDYLHGRWIGSLQSRGRTRAARLVVASSVLINLGLLGFFKYSGLAALPLGISFYTFQTMSYTIDVYRKEAEVQKDIIAFGAYVSMFPQLVAGPIVRYQTIAGEMKGRRENYRDFASGVRCFVIGLGKKVLIANQMGALWNEIQGVPAKERSVLMLWLGILAFGMQIYYDFSGYSDMAVGLGRMMGFHFPENFHYPYLAKSITDFWRRWHISLGTWFREYVYVPLGGNRRGRAMQVRNILIVWLLTGIWHGAGWNFLLWGLYFGVLLLLEKFWLKPYLERLPGWAQGTYAMALVFLGWVLFAHEDLWAGLYYLEQMAGLSGIPFMGERTIYLLMTSLPLLAAAVAGCGPWPKVWFAGLTRDGLGEARPWAYLVELAGILAILVLCTAYLVDASYNPFLYFRF